MLRGVASKHLNNHYIESIRTDVGGFMWLAFALMDLEVNIVSAGREEG